MRGYSYNVQDTEFVPVLLLFRMSELVASRELYGAWADSQSPQPIRVYGSLIEQIK